LTEINCAAARRHTLEEMDSAFRRYVEECPDAVLITDPAGRIVHVNAVFERMTGYALSELAGRTPALLKSGVHEADFYRGLWTALLAGREFRALFANRRKNGEQYYEEKIIRPLFDRAGRVTHFVSYGRDATDRAREFQRLEHAATHDSLTDLPNRALFLDRLGQALRHAARQNEPLSVAMVDLDRFRDINTRFGHLAGDAVLQAVGARTRACLRAADTVARIGGDEFAVLLPGAPQPQAAGVIGKVVVANGAPVRYEGRDIRATVSAGAASYPAHARDGEVLRRLADQAMYRAKTRGGNCCVFYGG
jgi:diguanylate cyclase (GGDEF)-like protein/PAS domain S-box-containing protein